MIWSKNGETLPKLATREPHGERKKNGEKLSNTYMHAGVKRCGKSCRLGWLNYVRPNIKRGNFNYIVKLTLILCFHQFLLKI